MSLNDPSDGAENLPDKIPVSSRRKKAGRAVLNTAGSIPFIGGLFAAAASHWSEKEQEEVNRFFEHWLSMLRDELKEKQITMIEVMTRLDLHDAEIKERLRSSEYQSLVRKCFREWSAAESESKRIYVRNVLTNSAASNLTSDDVVRLFLEWLKNYSDMHFEVIAAIYNRDGITRGEIWRQIGRGAVREDSAEADLFKLLIRDLSTGSIIRQHRPRDRFGNAIPKPRSKPVQGGKPPVSAFDEEEGYELTALGQQFIHYAMNDITPKIAYEPVFEDEEAQFS